MIDWAKPIEYLWELTANAKGWYPATVVYTARKNPNVKLIVIHVGDSDHTQWLNSDEKCVRNTLAKHVAYVHLHENGVAIIHRAQPDGYCGYCGGHNVQITDYECRRIEWEG